MATNFPASLDTLTNPTSSDSLSSPSHSAQHANVNDAVEALQAKVGADSSAVTSSHDYKIAQLEAQGVATAFTPSWTGFTVGNAVESWYYVQVNDLVIVQGITELGSTSSVTGNWRMDYPLGIPARVGNFVGNLACFGSTNSAGACQLGATQIIFNYYTVSGSTVWVAQVNATQPFSWTTGDELRASFMYQLS